ncbi:hypothetical protein GCM10009022_02640 [Vreelandella titanicae]
MVSTLRRREWVDMGLLHGKNVTVRLGYPSWATYAAENVHTKHTNEPPEGGSLVCIKHGKLLRGVTFRVAGVVIRLLGDGVVILDLLLERLIGVIDTRS